MGDVVGAPVHAKMSVNATTHAETVLASDERTSNLTSSVDPTVSVTLSSSSLASAGTVTTRKPPAPAMPKRRSTSHVDVARIISVQASPSVQCAVSVASSAVVKRSSHCAAGKLMLRSSMPTSSAHSSWHSVGIGDVGGSVGAGVGTPYRSRRDVYSS